MLISPTEPKQLKALGEVSGLPEQYGCDVLIVGTDNKRTGVQRKKFPQDLGASLSDGRLPQQLAKMITLDRVLLILEGYGMWTTDGVLLERHNLTLQSVYSMVYSFAWEYGVEVLWVRDLPQTVMALQALERWVEKPKHRSLMQRPGPQSDGWGVITERMRQLHMLQSFPGVGLELSERILDFYGRVPLRWDTTKEELMQIPGIGKVKAERIIGSLS